MVESFDVCIVGAGPAGCYLAQKLANTHSVLLIEKNESVRTNNFSSAGMPKFFLNKFDIPKESIASEWNSIDIVGTKAHAKWESEEALGAVLEFYKLKQYYLNKATVLGAEVKFATEYISHNIQENKIHIRIKNETENWGINANILVDATGASNSILNKDNHRKEIATGVEYRIRAKLNDDKFKHKLVFFLGPKWSPSGYGWIFPMGHDEYKVGVGLVKKQYFKDMERYTEKIINEYLGIIEYELLDKHGGTLTFSNNNGVHYYSDKIIGIGDSVYTVNPLGGEGIRHALISADIASEYIMEYLNGKIDALQRYAAHIKKIKGIKWKFSKFSADIVYKHFDEYKTDRLIYLTQELSTNEIIDVLFGYRYFKVTTKLVLKVIKNRLNRLWK